MKKIICLMFSLVMIMLCFPEKTFAEEKDSIVYTEHNNSQNRIALTFDDGPHSEYTEMILDILKEYGVRATFFVIGENAEQYPELVLREIEEGHEVGNHTFYHKSMQKATATSLLDELTKVEETLTTICDYYDLKAFRPPEGVCNNCIIKTAKEKEYNIILWTIDTEDWRHKSQKSIVDTIMKNVKAGSIILCHDYISGESNTVEAIRYVIPKLLDMGYEFVTASELIESK